MKTRLMLAVLLLGFAVPAMGGEKSYQKGVLLEMESVSCGYDEKSGKSFGGALIGTDSGSRKTKEMLCQEYTLRGERVIYRIRPKEEKKPLLLPVGEEIEYRIDKEKMKVLVREIDKKERDFIVTSIVPRSDVKNARLSTDSPKQ